MEAIESGGQERWATWLGCRRSRRVIISNLNHLDCRPCRYSCSAPTVQAPGGFIRPETEQQGHHWLLSSGSPGRDWWYDCWRIFSIPPDSFGFARSSSTSLEFQSVLLLVAGRCYFLFITPNLIISAHLYLGSSGVPRRGLWENFARSSTPLAAGPVAFAPHR